MADNEYITVKLPKHLGDVLDEHIKTARITYSSRAELIKELIRKYFNEDPKDNGQNHHANKKNTPETNKDGDGEGGTT